jgi:hypothetical protein
LSPYPASFYLPFTQIEVTPHFIHNPLGLLLLLASLPPRVRPLFSFFSLRSDITRLRLTQLNKPKLRDLLLLLAALLLAALTLFTRPRAQTTRCAQTIKKTLGSPAFAVSLLLLFVLSWCDSLLNVSGSRSFCSLCAYPFVLCVSRVLIGAAQEAHWTVSGPFT